MNAKLVRAIESAFRQHADPTKAASMRAYMKSEMPYRGVATPLQRALCRPIFREHPLEDFRAWRDTVLELWSNAGFREERYAAIELAGQRAYWPWFGMRALPVFERMIVEGAWWDYVDAIATHHLFLMLGRNRDRMSAKMRIWARSRDVWKRRSAILCQNPMKKDTDRALLYDCIEPSIDSDEFFLRKAIGWALRQYSYSDPNEVVRYVKRNRARLSPLSKREALKALRRQGVVSEIP